MAMDKVYVAAMSVSFAGAVFLSIALSTPYWLQNRSGRSISDKFEHGGLWSMCFRNWDPKNDENNKYYDGCYYVFEKELEFIRHIIAPGWFTGVQVLVSFCTFALLLAGLIQFSHFMRFFGHPMVVRLGSAIFSFFMAILMCIAVILYGVRSADTFWMPDPERNYLSWSFVFAVVTTFLCVVSAMLFVVTTLTTRYQKNSEEDYSMNSHYRY